jgi:hypothetical protein
MMSKLGNGRRAKRHRVQEEEEVVTHSLHIICATYSHSYCCYLGPCLPFPARAVAEWLVQYCYW